MDPTETPREYYDRLIAEKMAQSYSHLDLDEGKFTIGALIDATMSIRDPEDAAAFYVGMVEYLNEQPDLDPRGAEYVAKANIGWCFGEGMYPELKAMWNDVTGATHPVFDMSSPSATEAFAAGMKHGAPA